MTCSLDQDCMSGFKSKIQKGFAPVSSVCLFVFTSTISSFPDASLSELSTAKYKKKKKNALEQKMAYYIKNIHLSSNCCWGAFCQYNSPRRILSSSGYGFSKSTFISLFILSKLGGADVYFDSFDAYDKTSVNCILAIITSQWPWLITRKPSPTYNH